MEAPSGDSSDIERLIVSLKEKPGSGLIFLPDAFTSARPDHFTALVGQCRIPAIYPLRFFCETGGLIFSRHLPAALRYSTVLYPTLIGFCAVLDPAELPVQRQPNLSCRN